MINSYLTTSAGIIRRHIHDILSIVLILKGISLENPKNGPGLEITRPWHLYICNGKLQKHSRYDEEKTTFCVRHEIILISRRVRTVDY